MDTVKPDQPTVTDNKKPQEKQRWELEYTPALESTRNVNIANQYQHFINGQPSPPHSKSYFPTYNPATGEKLADIALGDNHDINKAVEAAQHAYHNIWSKCSPANRGRYLFRISRILQERAREFAVLETLDNGKPIRESRDTDIPLAASHFFYYAGWADKLKYAFPGEMPMPLGVAGQIIPWNFPLMMAAWKIAPALATGNCVVLKPAETTPLTALLLTEVLQQADLPPGVVNIVTGDGSTGEALVNHPNVQKIAFTGSTNVGKKIARATALTSKKLTLELGGKSAQILFADAALDQAIEGIVQGIFFNQGHVCCAGSRLLIEESILPMTLDLLKKRMSKIRVGNPLDKNTDMGAINSPGEYQKINKLIQDGKTSKLDFYQSPQTYNTTSGQFISPCFFSKVPASSSIFRQEIFGPVLSISTFRTPDEAIRQANDSPYGLAAGIWSEKSSKIQKVARALQAGVVWTNTYNRFDPSSPFGGFFESGWGREGGLHGLSPYLKMPSQNIEKGHP